MILSTPFDHQRTERIQPEYQISSGDFVSADEVIHNVGKVDSLRSSRAHCVTSSVAPHALPAAILEPKRASSIAPLRTTP